MVKSTMQNLRARVQKSGTTYYYFDAGGTPRKEIPLGSDYVLAVRKWADLMAKEHEAAPVANFIELIGKYEREELPRLARSTQATVRSDLKHLREFFSQPTPAPLDQIRPTHIKALLTWKQSQPQTANRLKRLFSNLFNKGRGWGYTERENPATGVQGLKVGKRMVYTTHEVFKAVWLCASEPLRDAMDLGYLTAQRPGDVLTRTEHHISNGTLEVRQSKTGTLRRIRIEGELEQLITRIKQRKARHKIWCANLTVNLHGMPLTKQVLRDHFTAAREAAALTAEKANKKDLAAAIRAMWFYDLRAKAADDVSDDRGDQAAADLLGHANVATTQRHYLRRGKTVGPTK